MEVPYWCVDVAVVACFVEVVMRLSICVIDDVLADWCLTVHLVCGAILYAVGFGCK